MTKKTMFPSVWQPGLGRAWFSEVVPVLAVLREENQQHFRSQ